jgi:hypothetical protein
MTARIGDGRSGWADGVLSRVSRDRRPARRRFRDARQDLVERC